MGELTLRTSVITHGSKGELALRGTFLFGAHGPKLRKREKISKIHYMNNDE